MGSNNQKPDDIVGDYIKMKEAADPDTKKSLTERVSRTHMTNKELVDEKCGQSFTRKYMNQNY